MNRNPNNGGTTIEYKTLKWPAAIPANVPNLPAPNNHTWPIFNLQGIEPVPQWPDGKGRELQAIENTDR
jgi:hypothetical protein